MLAGLRGILQPVVRGLARAQVGAIEAGIWIKEKLEIAIYGELYTDYDRFARQDFIKSEVPLLNQDYLIPGELHAPSVWNLKQKYRYEVLTPWENIEGKSFEQYTTITSDERLTPNEVLEQAADHPTVYPPEEGAMFGEQTIEGVWVRE